ncbi:ABC transporter ATP-binding protein [Alkalicella caledoniensis]|uniref:ABC transporter ATP-binding protein n=1 Tax=Alkalicella caledoniensis TaxID=2731377 RepID=A0A7G9W4B1_ALKCA|nr:ABC transporter ATP-binding protein [Alkalicella caledoniensis]QNO13523.1 ABC transporter ATP-binding protein [Alkalicella caledoniensis]
MNLEISNISKIYNNKVILDNISFQLFGGIYGLVGPNGAGKTTLMRIICDILPQDKGYISFDGMKKEDLDEKYRDLLGYLPQELGFYEHFTGEEFLRYIAVLKGLTKKETDKKVQETLELVNLTYEKKKKIAKYSGGMKRRLGIAQALLNDPKILILDEPTVGLDPMERIRFKNLLSRISVNKVIILSTHIISDIEGLATEVILMNKGTLKGKYSPEELLGNVNGKVFEIKIEENMYGEYNETYLISRREIESDGQVRLRIISDKEVKEGNLVKGSLEDAYIYHLEKEGEKNGYSH